MKRSVQEQKGLFFNYHNLKKIEVERIFQILTRSLMLREEFILTILCLPRLC
jgi:hypothetical protein